MSSKEFQTNLTFSETCLWIQSLGENAESMEELAGLTNTLSEQMDWFLSESSMPVPQIARKALKALEKRGIARALGAVRKGDAAGAVAILEEAA